MPTESVFFDTNIFLYALLDFQDKQKHDIAVNLLSKNPRGAISTQVVNEVCSNLIRLAKASEMIVEQAIHNFFSKYFVVLPSESTLKRASQLRQNHKFSYWDSIIIASALEAKSSVLYSEDMQHHLVIEKSLTIINPFIN